MLNTAIKTKHKAILVNCELDVPVTVKLPQSRLKYQFYDIREPHLVALWASLASTDWDYLNNNCLSVDEIYDKFVEICTELINNNIPMRTVTLGRNDPYFVSPLVKTLLRKRNKLMHKNKLEAVARLNTKISSLISQNRQSLMTKANNGDIKSL